MTPRGSSTAISESAAEAGLATSSTMSEDPVAPDPLSFRALVATRIWRRAHNRCELGGAEAAATPLGQAPPALTIGYAEVKQTERAEQGRAVRLEVEPLPNMFRRRAGSTETKSGTAHLPPSPSADAHTPWHPTVSLRACFPLSWELQCPTSQPCQSERSLRVIDPESIDTLRDELAASIQRDRRVLDELREDVRPLKGQTRKIHPRSTTAISLVGTDGGNNKIEFDPFMVQLVRVVDSSNNEYCLEVVTPTSDRVEVNARHFDAAGAPTTALGQMLTHLLPEGERVIWNVTTMIPAPQEPGEKVKPISPSWVQVYRELMEWAVLLKLVSEHRYGSDTVIIADGNLRSKVFKGELFVKFRQLLTDAIEAQKRSKRNIYIAGVSKHSKVLQRYRLAMKIEGILRTDYPAYVEVPRDLEEKAYVWGEYARGDEEADKFGGEANKFVGGKMFFVKFGSRPHDPIWPIDIFLPQATDAPTVLGYMLADAIDGFPVPFYPQCLQRAHENAALVDFDMTILQDEVIRSVRGILAEHADRLDEMTLQPSDPSSARYR